MKKSLLLSFIFVFALVVQVLAQNRTVTGKVTDQETGLGLPGVTVLVKGTSAGTATGVDGGFSIDVPSSDAVLVFRYVGYTNKEVTVGNQTSFNVQLAVDAKTLSEVVVVGYSTSTKESFTGTAKVVSGEKLESKNVANVSQALAGEVSGVRVINTSGQPGTAATIRIRGIGSVNGNRDPLYVVDGIPYQGSINAINPADIESTTVLKDAAATAIYGSRGANGVVVITTKSGRGKKAFIEADANFGTNMQLIPRYDVIKSPEQFIGLTWEGLYNQRVALNNADADPTNDVNPTTFANDRLFSGGGVAPGYNMWNTDAAGLIDPATKTVRPGVTRKYNPENWEDYGFQNSARREVNVKFGGSNGKTNYYSSLGYLGDKGYLINSDYERVTARLNVNQEINKWLDGAFNFGYVRSETNNNGQSSDSGSIFWFVDNIPSIYPLFMRDGEGNIVNDPIFGGGQYDYGTVNARGFGGLTNSIADATYDISRSNRNELNGTISMNVNIMDGLVLENRFGAQYFHNKYINRGNKFYGGSASQNGSIFIQRDEMFTYNLLNMLRFNKTFGQHTIEALAAHEASDWSNQRLTASGYNLVHPDILELSNAIVKNPTQNTFTNSYSLESYFGQLNYDFDKKYFISGTLRRDGSSRFVKDKWGTFGSVGAAWVISNEDFMDNQELISNLKFKASYGLLGDQAGIGLYPGYNLWNADNLNDQPSIYEAVNGNPDLTWETSRMFQTGVEFGIGKYLSGSIDYYLKNTTDLIFSRRVGPSAGIALINVNDGNLRNQGLEFDLTGDVFQGKDYRLSIGVNGEIFTNKITKMPIDPATGLPKVIDTSTSPYGWSEGRSIYDFYVREWAGVDPADGRAMWTVHYNDANGNNAFDSGEQVASIAEYMAANPDAELSVATTKTYSQATLKYTGQSAIPDVRGAVNLSTGYKGFDLSIQMLYSIGGYAYDGAYAGLMHNGLAGSNNWHKDILNRWQEPGDVTDVPRLSNNQDVNVNAVSSRFITKGDYLALNNIRLSYTLPSSIVSKYGIGGLSVWVSGDNLWLKTARDGFNPSTNEAGASSTYRYSPLSTVTAGLRVKI